MSAKQLEAKKAAREELVTELRAMVESDPLDENAANELYGKVEALEAEIDSLDVAGAARRKWGKKLRDMTKYG